MLLTSLLTAAVLWSTLTTSPANPTPIEGRVFVHADLDADSVMELIVSQPDTCDADDRCLLSVVQPDESGGFRTLLPPTRMWDLSAGERPEGGAWVDLIEARRIGPSPDDITVLTWRHDGARYRLLEGSRKTLPSTPEWAKGN